MKFFWPVAVFCFCITLSACDDNVVYKAHEDIKDGLWYIKDKPAFKVEIKDTAQQYNVYYLLRNTLQYPYYNLYLSRNLTGPDETLVSNAMEELRLSDETTGKPYGKGLGDLFDHKIQFLKNYRFEKSGTYTFTISQSMRQNPLPFVVSVGISVEKVKKTGN